MQMYNMLIKGFSLKVSLAIQLDFISHGVTKMFPMLVCFMTPKRFLTSSIQACKVIYFCGHSFQSL